MRSTLLLVTVLLTLGMQQVLAAAGDVSIQPPSIDVPTEQSFDLSVQVDSGPLQIGAFDFTVSYDPAALQLDTSIGNNGVEPGPDGFAPAAVDATTPGQITINGFSIAGAGPGTALDFLTIHFIAGTIPGSTPVDIVVNTLADPLGTSLPTGQSTGSTVTVTGDVYTLTVTNGGNGTVTSAPPGIDCGTDCEEDYNEGTEVTLTAVPDTGYQFDGWTGDCDINGNVTMDADRTCGATFSILPPITYQLTVTNGGNGTVTSSPAGIDCGTDCTEEYEAGTSVALTATPDTGYQFDGWTGDCDVDGNVTMDADRTCGATFSILPPITYQLTVTNGGNGTVTSSPAGIDCGTDCTEEYEAGTSVALTATPDTGYQFDGWTGDCDVDGNVTIDADRTCGATFSILPPITYQLTVTNGGNGTVTSSPAGIDCGTDCTEEYEAGTSVALTATPDTGYQFDGWTGDCDVDGNVTMDADRTCGATFSILPPITYQLTVTNGGNGTVTSNPAGIDCGTDCTEEYEAGTSVALTATPDTGYQFDGWTGDCDVDGNVTMDADRTCGATFSILPPITYQLTVTNGGNGTVTSSPAGIDCGTDCTEEYEAGTSVALTATPDTGYQFDGWTGDCDINGNVTMDADRTCGATFSILPPITYQLTVTNGGNGTVTSSPAGIDCGTDCTEEYEAGTSVALTATPDTGYQFDGWTGDCDVDGNVTMDADRTCSATFIQIPTYTLTINNQTPDQGTITSNPPGIDCGMDCTEDYEKGTQVRLLMTPKPGFQFGGWGGDNCNIVRNVVTMNAANTCEAQFVVRTTQAIPTLSAWGLIALSGALGLLGAFARRRNR
ncbi:MAG: IPTL-CTERM sorting domain-containing protein [Thiohalocapsa sp. PB-PSB1]|nr:MAG: IPTL-CTERM sorting domain-containing protein [Thiohalocapsa sp. PB-PSB1]